MNKFLKPIYKSVLKLMPAWTKSEIDDCIKDEKTWWFKKKLISIAIYFRSPRDDYHFDLKPDAYFEGFKINEDKEVTIKDETHPLETAYNKACENRDFEIEKFWSRAAYFWGFILVIFTGYFTVASSKDLPVDQKKFFELCLICLGIIFSVAWYCVIKGSKHWQENWERHIDRLEDTITGPLFKTVYYEGRFYSVSKVNLVLSVVIIITWGGLLLEFLKECHVLPCSRFAWDLIDWQITIMLSITGIFLIVLLSGYGSKKFENSKGGFIRRPKPKNQVQSQSMQTKI